MENAYYEGEWWNGSEFEQQSEEEFDEADYLKWIEEEARALEEEDLEELEQKMKNAAVS